LHYRTTKASIEGTFLHPIGFIGERWKIMKKLAVVIISLMTAFTGIAPAQAFPVVNIEKPNVVTSDVQQVRDRRIIRRGHSRHYSDRRYRDHRYNGHRYNGNRYYGHRRYYRNHNNTGAIIGGLAAGAIIGGALSASQQPRYYNGNSHARWCANRYRSYRASDNTFQPNYGPRRQCVSS
jgi:hypothetical protein